MFASVLMSCNFELFVFVFNLFSRRGSVDILILDYGEGIDVTEYPPL